MKNENDFSELYSAVRTVPAAADRHSVTMSGRNSLPELVDSGPSRRLSQSGSYGAPVQRAAYRGWDTEFYGAVWVQASVSSRPLQLSVSIINCGMTRRDAIISMRANANDAQQQQASARKLSATIIISNCSIIFCTITNIQIRERSQLT